jgi:hypothetical protein
MATLKRNAEGDFILRFRTSGRGSKLSSAAAETCLEGACSARK